MAEISNFGIDSTSTFLSGAQKLNVGELERDEWRGVIYLERLRTILTSCGFDIETFDLPKLL